MPGEKLSIPEAIGLFTTGSAAAAGEERERGRIAPGLQGDFTVIDRDVLSDPEELLLVKVRMTVVNGKIAYCAQ